MPPCHSEVRHQRCRPASFDAGCCDSARWRRQSLCRSKETVMPSGCHHLAHGERCRTCALRKSGLSDPAIARQLGRDRTTVRREIRRNGGGGRWRTGWRRAGARTEPPAASGRRASRWRAGSGRAGPRVDGPRNTGAINLAEATPMKGETEPTSTNLSSDSGLNPK